MSQDYTVDLRVCGGDAREKGIGGVLRERGPTCGKYGVVPYCRRLRANCGPYPDHVGAEEPR